MHLKDGYRIDREYIHTCWPICSPSFMALQALLKGVEPPDTRLFSYADLGCGFAYQVNLFAAANPEGRFYGVDFMPEHVAGASHLADEAGLSNARFVEAGFLDLANAPERVEPCDYVVLHGVWSWINEPSRDALVALLDRIVKPGGLVYVSFNAAPGALVMGAIQKFLFEYAERRGGDPAEAVREGLALCQEIARNERSLFATSQAKERFEHSREANPTYLVHEYLNESWRAFTCLETSRRLAPAGLSYAGRAQAVPGDPEFGFGAAQRQLLPAGDEVWRETVADHVSGRIFRTDIYHRGARRLSAEERAARLRAQPIALLVPPETFPDRLDVSAKTLSDPALHAAMREALLDRPRTIGALAERVMSRIDVSFEAIAWLVAIHCGEARLAPALAHDVDPAPARRMNALVAADRPFGARYRYYASPTTGSAVRADRFTSLALEVIDREGLLPPAVLAERMAEVAAETGNVAIDNELDRRAELAKFAVLFTDRVVPLVRGLGLRGQDFARPTA